MHLDLLRQKLLTAIAMGGIAACGGNIDTGDGTRDLGETGGSGGQTGGVEEAIAADRGAPARHQREALGAVAQAVL